MNKGYIKKVETRVLRQLDRFFDVERKLSQVRLSKSCLNLDTMYNVHCTCLD